MIRLTLILIATLCVTAIVWWTQNLTVRNLEASSSHSGEVSRIEWVDIQKATWPDSVFSQQFQKEVVLAAPAATIEPVKIPSVTVTVPVTLEGTIVDTDPERSAAVFRNSSGKQFVVTLKEPLPNPDSNWILQDVQADRAILSAAGSTHTLELKQTARK